MENKKQNLEINIDSDLQFQKPTASNGGPISMEMPPRPSELEINQDPLFSNTPRPLDVVMSPTSPVKNQIIENTGVVGPKKDLMDVETPIIKDKLEETVSDVKESFENVVKKTNEKNTKKYLYIGIPLILLLSGGAYYFFNKK